MTIIFSILAIVLYLILGFLVGRQMFSKNRPLSPQELLDKRLFISLGLAAVILHSTALYHNIFIGSGVGFNFGFFNAISLVSWFIALLLIVATLTKPVESLGIIVFPLAALALLLENIFPTSHIILTSEAKELRLHILISILAYSVLSIAAIQAILLAIQNKYLRNKHPGGFIRSFPPMETMESLLFKMIGVGFVLQSISLVTGMLYLENMFEQHLAHKTILSIVSWFVFAVLLLLDLTIAIRWTLAGFIILLLAYLGSKMVLEIFLGRHNY